MCLDVYRLTKKPAQTALTSQSEDFPLSVSKSEAKTKLLLSWVTRSLPQFTPTTLALDLSHFFFHFGFFWIGYTFIAVEMRITGFLSHWTTTLF